MYIFDFGIQSSLTRLIGVGVKFNPFTPTVVMGTGIKHPVPVRVKLSFVIFDIWAGTLTLRSCRGQAPTRTKLTLFHWGFARACRACCFIADRTNGRAYATVLRPSVVVCLSSVTLCIVAKRCVL